MTIFGILHTIRDCIFIFNVITTWYSPQHTINHLKVNRIAKFSLSFSHLLSNQRNSDIEPKLKHLKIQQEIATNSWNYRHVWKYRPSFASRSTRSLSDRPTSTHSRPSLWWSQRWSPNWGAYGKRSIPRAIEEAPSTPGPASRPEVSSRTRTRFSLVRTVHCAALAPERGNRTAEGDRSPRIRERRFWGTHRSSRGGALSRTIRQRRSW